MPSCPECPPWYDINISGGGGGSGNGGDDSSSTKSESSSSSTSEESTITVAGATVVIADAFPTTTDAMTALEALESSEAGLIKSLYGAEMSYLITAVSNTATAQSTATPTTTANPYSITITDSSGDIVACSSDLVLEFEGGPSTACVGDVSTISKHSTTSTTSTTAIPTPTGFGLMIFSDTNCEEYIDGYTWDSNGKCYDAGTEINSYIITTESDRCDDEENAIFQVWYVTTDCNAGTYTPSSSFLFLDDFPMILIVFFFFFLEQRVILEAVAELAVRPVYASRIISQEQPNMLFPKTASQ